MLAALSLPSPPSPVLVELGPLILRWFGVFLVLGIVAGTFVTARELRRRGHDGAIALDALLFVVPLGFVGARLDHVLTNLGLYDGDPYSFLPGIFQVWNGDFGIYGAILGGFLGVLLFTRFNRGIGALTFADAIVPGLALGQAIGRFGDYFDQERFGRPADLPWAIRIAPDFRPASYADAEAFHPTFLYESLWDLLVCGVLLLVARRFARRLKSGDVLLLYVSLYSLGRFFVETLRVDESFIIGDGFRGNLLLSAVLALTFALILFLRHAGTADRKCPPRGVSDA
jgi:prolipoprotein diacylglyceryl transferase